MSSADRAGTPPDRPSLRAFATTAAGALATALLSVELIAAMQTYLTATVTPLLAGDLEAQHLYGVVQAAPEVAMFLTMPLGVMLLSRVGAPRLLLAFTGVTAVGAVVSAIAPGIEVFLAGRILSGLAAGALATVSMGAVATGLPAEWRRVVLAGYAAVWVAASLVGPAYAAWVSSTLGWRWALVLYLPLLAAARWVAARHLPVTPESETTRLDVLSTLLLTGGIALVAVPVTGLGAWRAALIGAGVVLAAIAALRLLPRGVGRVRPGRPAAIVLLGWLCGVYFGAQAVTAIAAHDVLGIDAAGLGVLLGAGGLGWAVTGIVVGRLTPRDAAAYRRRVRLGTGALATGLAAMAGALAVASAPLLVVGWAITGVGMGLVYLDTLNRIITTPPVADGISPTRAAGAAVLIESVATAVVATLTTTTAALVVAGASPLPSSSGAAAVFAALAGAAVAMLIVVRRAAHDPAVPG